MLDLLVNCKQSCCAMTVFCKKAVYFNICNIPTRSLVSVKRYKIIIARPLKISNYAIMAVAVQMDSVHIRGNRITKIKIKNNILDRKIRSGIDHKCIICIESK